VFSEYCTAFLQVDMSKVNLDTIKPWIYKRVTELLGFEDDVVIEFIFNQLEEKASAHCSISHLLLHSANFSTFFFLYFQNNLAIDFVTSVFTFCLILSHT
jgi:PWI domain